MDVGAVCSVFSLVSLASPSSLPYPSPFFCPCLSISPSLCLLLRVFLLITTAFLDRRSRCRLSPRCGASRTSFSRRTTRVGPSVTAHGVSSTCSGTWICGSESARRAGGRRARDRPRIGRASEESAKAVQSARGGGTQSHRVLTRPTVANPGTLLHAFVFYWRGGAVRLWGRIPVPPAPSSGLANMYFCPGVPRRQ